MNNGFPSSSSSISLSKWYISRHQLSDEPKPTEMNALATIFILNGPASRSIMIQLNVNKSFFFYCCRCVFHFMHAAMAYQHHQSRTSRSSGRKKRKYIEYMCVVTVRWTGRWMSGRGRASSGHAITNHEILTNHATRIAIYFLLFFPIFIGIGLDTASNARRECSRS